MSNTQLANIDQKPIDKKKGRVRLQPMNEGQEVNICQTISGTSAEIVARSTHIIEILSELFPGSTFTVKVESMKADEWIYLDRNFIYNDNFEQISTVKNFAKHF